MRNMSHRCKRGKCPQKFFSSLLFFFLSKWRWWVQVWMIIGVWYKRKQVRSSFLFKCIHKPCERRLCLCHSVTIRLYILEPNCVQLLTEPSFSPSTFPHNFQSSTIKPPHTHSILFTSALKTSFHLSSLTFSFNGFSFYFKSLTKVALGLCSVWVLGDCFCW